MKETDTKTNAETIVDEMAETIVEDINNDMLLDSSLKAGVEENLENMLVEKEEKEIEEKKTVMPWKMDKKGKAAVAKAVGIMNTTYGLYATIPLVCKGEECVYAKLFPDTHDGLSVEGQRCPVEVAMIMTKYDQYKKELNIAEEDAVDMSILRDVIDYDIQIIRAENKMAVEGDFVKDVTIGISQTGVPIIQEQISQAAEYKDKIQKKRNDSLKLLNSTRKDKAGINVNHIMDPSTYATKLLQEDTDFLDAEFEELEVIPDVEINF